MTSVTPAYLSILDPRAAKAVTIVDANRWKIFRDSDGRLSFSIPSSKAGVYYRTTDNGCTCADLKYRPWTVCKHMLAVRIATQAEVAF